MTLIRVEMNGELDRIRKKVINEETEKDLSFVKQEN
jgi:hypothetical protein